MWDYISSRQTNLILKYPILRWALYIIAFLLITHRYGDEKQFIYFAF